MPLPSGFCGATLLAPVLAFDSRANFLKSFILSTLELVSLRKQFGDVVAVHDLNISVADGEFLCILGPSGCGKSTALRMIAGFEDPSAGDVRIDSSSVLDLPPNHRPTAMVFQKYTLWPHMRVFDNIAFGLRLRHQSRIEIDTAVGQSLDMVGLNNYGQRYPAQLSGGEQQRVAIARALVLKPKILLLDEPFSNLDALLRVRLRDELRTIQRNLKITAVFVTHDQEEALSLADRIAVMRKGNLEQIDKPGVIYATPKTLFVADFIGAMNLMQGEVFDGHVKIGNLRLDVPAATAAGQTTVALRPEDVRINPDVASDSTWHGQVTQISDLGHYRKVWASVSGLSDQEGNPGGALKMFLPKSIGISEGETIGIVPTRFLLYQGGASPVEVRR